jgi:hypothetical protein
MSKEAILVVAVLAANEISAVAKATRGRISAAAITVVRDSLLTRFRAAVFRAITPLRPTKVRTPARRDMPPRGRPTFATR